MVLLTTLVVCGQLRFSAYPAPRNEAGPPPRFAAYPAKRAKVALPPLIPAAMGFNEAVSASVAERKAVLFYVGPDGAARQAVQEAAAEAGAIFGWVQPGETSPLPAGVSYGLPEGNTVRWTLWRSPGGPPRSTVPTTWQPLAAVGTADPNCVGVS